VSRSYGSVPTLSRLSDYSIGRTIRESAAAPDFSGVDRLAENANTIYAKWAPSLWAQECYDADGGHMLTWLNAAPVEDLLAFRFRCLGDAIHVSGGGIKADLLGRVTGATTSAVEVRTINGGDAETVNHSAVTDAWATTANALQYAQDANDREIVVIGGYRDAGAGTCALRHVHLYYMPYTGGAGALDAGDEPSGFIAHDVAQYDSQSPLSAGALSELEDSHKLLRRMFPWPVGGFAVDLRGLADPKSIPGGTIVTYETMAWRMPYWRRRGEGVTTLAYSLLGAHEAAGDGGRARIRVRVDGGTEALDDTGALVLPIAPDHTDLTDWLDGTLDISRAREGTADNPGPTLWIEAWVWSLTAGQGSGLFSLCIQEEPGAP